MSTWRIETTDDKKFPYRITIIENSKVILNLFAQDKWPGTKGNIFCLQVREDIDPDAFKITEEVPIVSLRRFGKKLSVVLDRSIKKRCEFLFLEKKYKNKEGTYEQIFFRTQTAIKQHRSKGSLNLKANIEELNIIIDSSERYAWKFAGHKTQTQKLNAGDYALLLNDDIAAVVERKTFDNMLSDTGQIQLLHQQLAELSLYPHVALVIEAQYGDFLDPSRVKKMSTPRLARIFAELTTLHPDLPIIFAGNRKNANFWALNFFEAIYKKHADPTIEVIANTIAKSRTTKAQPIWLKVKNVVLTEMPHEFKTSDLKQQLPELTVSQIKSQLERLSETNVITKEKSGRNIIWRKHINSLSLQKSDK